MTRILECEDESHLLLFALHHSSVEFSGKWIADFDAMQQQIKKGLLTSPFYLLYLKLLSLSV